jgi:hypothetical protein
VSQAMPNKGLSWGNPYGVFGRLSNQHKKPINIEEYGRPERTRTVDLHRVNCAVRKLNPFACLAFSFLTS